MIVPKEIRNAYESIRTAVSEAAKRVSETVRPFCDSEDFLFHGRTKSAESLAEKVESGRFARWSAIEDLYACTIVVPLLDDEDRVLKFLQERFEQVSLKKRREIRKPPDVFRFDATRFVGRLVAPNEDLAQEPIYRVLFEVQIQTVFEFAWTRTTHALTYKAQAVDWRRFRLAAHLKAAVEQLDMLVLSFDEASEWVTAGSSPDVEDKQTILQFFSRLSQEEKLPSEVIPHDWSRFVDNLYRALQALQGEMVTGRSQHRLRILSESIKILEDFFEEQHDDSFPRSISLFQIALGALVASKRFDGRSEHYFFPLTDGFRLIFPAINPPGELFSFD